jgi:hypothetical protein
MCLFLGLLAQMITVQRVYIYTDVQHVQCVTTPGQRTLNKTEGKGNILSSQENYEMFIQLYLSRR